ncbi:MAG: formate--tetrahydrofolate ligase [Candidatus Omnitrophica bacterium]|nr:formate--tetrahydrofolate ligase [Candidatus Omnitrophota bacterium]
MPSNIEISQSARPLQIIEIARRAGLRLEEIDMYGQYKAKVSLKALERVQSRPYGKLILVTAITPTEAGEGKTSTAIGLTQAMGRLRKKVILTLREPAIGPIFGVKGGACGSGFSQILPMDDINLHFTGDIHAIGTAHNLLAAMVDNHVINPGEVEVDPARILWRRVTEIPDRNLRHIVAGMGEGAGYFKHETGFDITVASEIMAILALATSFADLKARLGRMVVAYDRQGKPVTAEMIRAVGSMALLLKDAVKPNLVQTLEGQPVFIHTGPFANLAHGTNSILANEMALRLADYCVTECGFGTDLGLEKFCDIVARGAGFKPEVAVVVLTARALKVHGGLTLEDASSGREDMRALTRGFENMERHLAIVRKFGLVPVVTINRFPLDTPTELKLIQEHCLGLKVRCAISTVAEQGGEGGIAVAQEVMGALQEKSASYRPLYPLEQPIKAKIEAIAREIYGADGVEYVETAEADIERLTRDGFGGLAINMAKSQLSLSDDPKAKGAPSGWKLKVRQVRVAAGAGFLIVMTGKILGLPGLPKQPLAEKLDIDENGRITGLF